MSASTKKKLRQEQVTAEVTKKQKAAKKEADKMKLYTAIFVAVVVFMLAVVGIAVIDRSGIVDRNATAAKVGDTKISAAEMNIFYVEAVGDFYTQYNNYISMFGLDIYTPLDQQTSTDGTESWADYFTDAAVDNAHACYAIYNAAQEAGYTMDETTKAQYDANIQAMHDAAEQLGYTNYDKYLKAVYGTGVTEEVFAHVMEVMAISTAYNVHYQNSLSYTDADLTAKDAEDPRLFTYYNYSTYVMNTKNYLEGGTEGEDGKTVYSDAEKEAARAACEADAQNLVNAKPASTEEMDKLILELPVNADLEVASTLVTEDMNITSAPDFMQSWLADESRKPGDITYMERTATNDDGITEVTGYNVVLFNGSNTNEFPLVNVRHILIQPSGGSVDPNTGMTAYSDAEMSIASKEAQAILDNWLAGEKTEESFAALANEYSADSDGTDGGLYTDVFYNEMVESFNDWCFDEARQTGDYALVESEYGVHVMYFVGHSETTHREYLITQALLSEEMDAWYNGQLETNAVERKNLSRVNRDLIIASYFASNISG